MSDFDLKLDRLSKISTIVIAVLGAIFTGYLFFFYEKPAYNIHVDNQCLNWLERAQKAHEEGSTVKHEAIIATSNKYCSKEDEQEQVVTIANLLFAQKSALENASQETSPSDPLLVEKQKGFVSLGKANDYVNSNFRNFKSGEKALKYPKSLTKGTVLQARWSVNLRTNTNDTESGKNPSIAIIRDDSCIKMEEDLPTPKRGSYWVRVSLTDCKLD